jgi:hypothetical protein
MPAYSPRRQTETLKNIEFIERARIVTGPELVVALALVLFGFLPLLGLWLLLRGLDFKLENVVALTLLGTYVFAVIETFAIIILWGLGRLYLPKAFVPWLGGATIGEIVTLLLIVVKRVFS